MRKFEFKSTEKVDEFLALIRRMWWLPDWGFVMKDEKLELHTGGWSGNESVITAMKKNFIFWSSTWVCKVTGGHFYFEISRLKKMCPNRKKP